VSTRYLEDGTKVRVAKVSGAIIPRPAILRERRVAVSTADGPKDTKSSTVLEKTYSDAGLVSLIAQLKEEQQKLAEMKAKKEKGA